MNPNSNSQSTISSDVEIIGSLHFQGELIFDGRLSDGDIKGNTLTIGPKSQIKGNIECEALTLLGSVTGDVLVTGRCELKGSANLVGSLTTNRLVMDEGATLIGQAEITPDTKKRATSASEATGPSFPPGLASLRPNRP